MAMTTGQFIRARRTVLRMTQQQLGEKCGYVGHCAATAVQYWENDVRVVPTERLRRLAKALHVPLDSPLIP